MDLNFNKIKMYNREFSNEYNFNKKCTSIKNNILKKSNINVKKSLKSLLKNNYNINKYDNSNKENIPINNKSIKNSPLLITKKYEKNKIVESPIAKKSKKGIILSDKNINLLRNSNLRLSYKINSPVLDKTNQSKNKYNNIKQSLNFKKSSKKIIYAVNTNIGKIRKYNEDRISIILNICHKTLLSKKEKNNNNINTISLKSPMLSKTSNYFSIFDGHGGAKCADYLKDNLHKFIFLNENFPFNINESFKSAFKNADDYFCKEAILHNDGSGSCAIVAFKIENYLYIANVGDSRAIISIENGKNILQLTTDHKPFENKEKERILKNGGAVYQSSTSTITEHGETKITGPYRVIPGKLSVSRTFGDIEAKDTNFGGKKGIIISEPDIYKIKITKNMDFLVLGSDGLFDVLSNDEIIKEIWKNIDQNDKDTLKNAAEMVNILAIKKGSTDNCSCIILFLNNNIFRTN